MHIRSLLVSLLVCAACPPVLGQAPTPSQPQAPTAQPAPATAPAPELATPRASLPVSPPAPTLGTPPAAAQAQPQTQVQAPVQTQPPAEAQAGAGAPHLLERGEALLNEGKLPEALAVLREAVAAAPHSSTAYQRLGGAQLMSQDYAGSVESFQRAISLDATNAAAFVGMGMAYLHTGRFGQARAAMVEAKRLDPSNQDKVEEVIAWIDQRASH